MQRIFLTENEQKATIRIHKPDIKEKLFFLGAGLLMSVPFTLFVSDFSNSLCVALPMIFEEVCSLVIFTPFIEEAAKIFPLFYRHGETERSIVNLGILTGLGFGITEFVLYISLGAPVISRIPGLIFHASSTCIAAYGIAKKKPIRFYLIAVAGHLANNFFALFSNTVPFLYVPALTLLMVIYLLAWRLYHQTSETMVL